ncbi:MAG: hypothetical protein A4E63_02456 [Syntrophorhabdus sp. PtaU1.Bin050]|nr:MAG: hypothetical protein A4E63_02456 [Syntrophorhabdus sp. PtaU1.Bin050]
MRTQPGPVVPISVHRDTIVGSVLSVLDVPVVRLRWLVLAASVSLRMQIGIIDPVMFAGSYGKSLFPRYELPCIGFSRQIDKKGRKRYKEHAVRPGNFLLRNDTEFGEVGKEDF